MSKPKKFKSVDKSTKDVWEGEEVSAQSQTKLEDDRGTGQAVIIRFFEFGANPEVFKQHKPTAQELFDSHRKGIESLLWRDGLKPLDGIEPRLIFSKNKKNYRFIITCIPLSGSVLNRSTSNTFTIINKMTPQITKINPAPQLVPYHFKKGITGDKHPTWKGGDPTKTPQARYHLRNRERNLEWEKKYYKEVKYERHQLVRKDALLKVGKGELKCSRCGCDEFKLLEINHINGCGHAERKEKYRSGIKFWKHILNGERTCDDLNVLCKACNILYYISRNYGLDNYEIKWKSTK